MFPQPPFQSMEVKRTISPKTISKYVLQLWTLITVSYVIFSTIQKNNENKYLFAKLVTNKEKGVSKLVTRK